MKLPKKKTKIFFINKFKWLDQAPMGTISTFFTHALAKIGYDTTLIIQGDPNSDVNKILQKRFGLEPLPNYHIRLFYRAKRKRIKSSGNFYGKAVKYILSQYDGRTRLVVMTRNTTFLPYLIFLKHAVNALVIFETHGYHGNKTLPGFPPPPPRPFLKLSHQYQITERLLLNRTHGLVCITSPQQRLYEQDFIKIPTVFLPLGAPSFSGASPDSFEKKTLCYIGRLNQHINVKMVFEAMNLIADKSVKLVWIGLRTPNFPVLEEAIKKYRLEGRVELIGWLGHGDMKNLLRERISAGLVAYRPTYQSVVFTSPSKIFDYFAVGLPVIAPGIATVKDIITDGRNGLLYHPTRAESLASSIERIFSDRERYFRLKETAIQLAEHYSWENRARRLIDFIENRVK